MVSLARQCDRALDTIEHVEGELDLLSQDGESRKKLLKAVREFRGYIEANQNFIPNYGDRYRHGEKISTAFAESAAKKVVSKRMVKKQQMRWTESGAHNLLQVRTKVLNDQLRETFVRWYPRMLTSLRPLWLRRLCNLYCRTLHDGVGWIENYGFLRCQARQHFDATPVVVADGDWH